MRGIIYGHHATKGVIVLLQMFRLNEFIRAGGICTRLPLCINGNVAAFYAVTYWIAYCALEEKILAPKASAINCTANWPRTLFPAVSSRDE